jgi:hypothetical protein
VEHKLPGTLSLLKNNDDGLAAVGWRLEVYIVGDILTCTKFALRQSGHIAVYVVLSDQKGGYV